MTTILIVDDHPINVQTLLVGLSSDPYSLFVARNGKEAIENAYALKPDLILLDIVMPDINGYEVCAHLKSDPDMADIPIIFLSALEETQDKLRGLQAGGEDYITKPFDIEEVRARIRVHLALREKRQQLEKLRQQDLAYFERINRFRDDILDQIKHDVKSPLATIKAAAYLTARIASSIDPRIAHYVEQTNLAVDEIVRVIEKLLEVAKLETGRSTQLKQVEIVPLLENVTALFHASAEQKHIILIREIGSIHPQANAWVDPDQLTSVLSNLISNAIKYTDAGGTVIVRAMLTGTTFHIEVQDTGRGIAPEYQQKIFERLFRVPSDADEVEGTGLGLYIVRSIIESHGGSISVTSQLGEGTTFYVDLPQPQAASHPMPQTKVS